MLWKTKGEVKEGGGVVKFGGGTATALKVDLTAPTRELGGVVNYFLDKIFLSLRRRRRSFSHFYNPAAHAKLFSAVWAICYILLAGRSACVFCFTRTQIFFRGAGALISVVGCGGTQANTRPKERERKKKWAAAVGN